MNSNGPTGNLERWNWDRKWGHFQGNNKSIFLKPKLLRFEGAPRIVNIMNKEETSTQTHHHDISEYSRKVHTMKFLPSFGEENKRSPTLQWGSDSTLTSHQRRAEAGWQWSGALLAQKENYFDSRILQRRAHLKTRDLSDTEVDVPGAFYWGCYFSMCPRRTSWRKNLAYPVAPWR